VQQLIGLGQGVDRVQRLLERGDDTQAIERLRGMRTSITALVGEVRGIIGALRPPALEELGLIPAIELLLGRAGEGAPAMSLLVQGRARRLAPQSELALFRIVQEAWSNIQRHAHAMQVTVVFTYAARQLTVTITDDGRGFELPDNVDRPDGHWGVRGMRERAELTGGELVVQSAPGAGTVLTVRIPYPGVDGRDPVCGMEVAPDALAAEHAGRLYRFCSSACRDLFLAQPQKYVAPAVGG
jgi:signal transduction histidine kinase/YHS domain-containing protein